MIPGVNPKLMKQAMKRMGIKEEPIDAIEVIIKLADRQIVIHNPNVSKVSMMGQETFQISGDTEEVSIKREAGGNEETEEIPEEDIKTVAEQAGVSKDKAKEALEETKGDLAEAIIKLRSKQ